MVLIITIIAVFIDQFSKYEAVKLLKGRGPYKLIDNILSLYYIENRGAAFGILQEKRFLFLLITGLVICGLIYYINLNYSSLTRFDKIAFGLFLGGTLGNLIDRVRLGYVVDFLSFKLVDSVSFPVFNIADIFIIVSTFMIMFIILFEDPIKGD